MVVVHIDTSGLVKQLQDKSEQYREDLKEGFARAGAAIVDLFRDKWLSGRGSDDLGLNIKTGRLHGSVRSLTTLSRSSIRSEVFNTGANYWAFHQDGTGTLPKRLFLEEAFEEDGEKLYKSEIEMALERLGK